MSSTPAPGAGRVAALWEEIAGRHACRAPLWSAPGAPRHLFLGRPLIHSPAPRATPVAQEAAELAHQGLGDGLSAAILRQEHGVSVRRVQGRQGLIESSGDGLTTDDPTLLLGVQSADCVPILIADRGRLAVAALHAGWRGTAAGMVPRALEHLAAEYGSRPEDLEAVLGPAIGGCCYVVGEEVRAALTAGPLRPLAVFSPAPDGRWKIDLAQLNAAALESAGVDRRRIELLSACTRCANQRLHSYRAEGSSVGRNWSFIGTPPRRPIWR